MMSEKIKLGLTRNRLFSFHNCVSFCGKAESDFDIAECEKALKMLWIKEPLLSGAVELEADGTAYVVLDENQAFLEVSQDSAMEYIWKKKMEGFDFSGKLFSFAVVEGNTLCICGHTAVADARSLMYLAGEFMAFYEKKTLDVNPSEISLISETREMPSNVFSVVVDRLASGLEVGWQKKTSVFDVQDYRNARKRYFEKQDSVGVLERTVSPELMTDLKAFAEREKVDVSSLVAFAFYESLCSALGGRRKYRKLNVQSNSRVFFEQGTQMKMGAFNSFFVVEKKKKRKMPKTLYNNAVNFHAEIYKRAISAFSVFYNEFFYMRLSEAFADSQYMYCAGLFKHKYSKKLANTYGCANEVLGEFCSYNLNQTYWSDLNSFCEVLPAEPLKMRSTSLITFVEKEGCSTVFLSYKKGKISDSVALGITEKAMDILGNFK